MRVLGKKILFEFCKRHSDVDSRISAWISEVEDAEWTCPADIKARYVDASILADNRVVFNIKGNKYRLDVRVAYKTQLVLVKRTGTHAEYSRWKF